MVTKFDVIIFDLDSTVVTIEGLPWLAQSTSQRKLPLLEASLDGEISLHQAFQEELHLLAPTYSDMLHLGRTYQDSLVDGAKEVLEELHLLGKEVWLMTNNFHPAIDVIGNTLGIPSERIIGSDIIYNQQGGYEGFDQQSLLVKNGGKAEMIKKFIHPDRKVAFIGDAVQDVETRPVVDLFVGYGGVVIRPVVKQRSHVYISEKSLFALLPILLEKDELELLQRHVTS